jgi:hypothetical protein
VSTGCRPLSTEPFALAPKGAQGFATPSEQNTSHSGNLVLILQELSNIG